MIYTPVTLTKNIKKKSECFKKNVFSYSSLFINNLQIIIIFYINLNYILIQYIKKIKILQYYYFLFYSVKL
jgi:hypothetical protein